MNAAVKIKTPRADAGRLAEGDTAAPAGAPLVTKGTITTARGRVISFKKLTALDRMRLALLVGGEASDNASFMLYANLAASVTAIDGEPCVLTSMRQLEARVQTLDEDGLGAVLQGWRDAGWAGAATPEQANAEHLDSTKN